jgi:hypothetical protein
MSAGGTRRSLALRPRPDGDRRLAIVVASGTFSIQAACASTHAVPTGADVREGVYIAGIEANTFRECGGQELRALRRGECGEQF